MKKRCAAIAFKKIHPHMVIGLGGGSTIGFLVDMIKEAQLDIQIVTPSEKTKQHCLEAGLTVLDPSFIATIDLAFDGCDEVDQDLQVLKSMGGIHTEEKIIAKMAKEYIVLVDESKVSSTLSFRVPITLEVVREALTSVLSNLSAKADVTPRMSQTSDAYTFTSRGTILVEFTPNDKHSLKEWNTYLLMLPGIVDTSLFYNIATRAIVVTKASDYELTGGRKHV